MSLKPHKFDTVEARAQRVIVAHGRAPNLLRSLDPDLVVALAGLCDEDGNLVPTALANVESPDEPGTLQQVEVDVREAFRLVLVEHNERQKAVVDDEAPAAVEDETDDTEGEPTSVR